MRDKLLETLAKSMGSSFTWMGFVHDVVELDPPFVRCLRHHDPLPNGTPFPPVAVLLPIVSVLAVLAEQSDD